MSRNRIWDAPRSRREFLGWGAFAASTALVSPALLRGGPAAGAETGPGYGPLREDAGGVVDLPRGFQYRILSAEQAVLTSGQEVPADHDGMAAFRGPGNTTVLVRNHELRDDEAPAVEGANPYDAKEPGGTTAIVVGPDRREVRSYVTSSGTRNNCAGGATPWGTWLTCEEDREEGHGFVFEVQHDAPESDLSKTPIRAMGLFSHEAVGIDPRTSIAYLTEDDFVGDVDPLDPSKDTRSSFLFRYIPDDRGHEPGALQRGGALEALVVDEEAAPRDPDLFDEGQGFPVRWIPVRPELAHEDALERGATRFNRLEGAFFAGGAFWFDDTAGGEARLGQVYRLIPGAGGDTLELFLEADDANAMESPDNIVVTPFGDLWFAEDGDGVNRVMGITPDGGVYEFARNRISGSEFAGPCFSPDGRTFFVNVQSPGLTLAIWGPFPRRSGARRRQMAHAAPPAALARRP